MSVSAITSEMLHSKEHLLDPYPLWERMRHDEPVFFDEITKTWVLTRYTDCVEAFANYEDFSNRLYRDTLGVVFGPTMLDKDGSEHVTHR